MDAKGFLAHVASREALVPLLDILFPTFAKRHESLKSMPAALAVD